MTEKMRFICLWGCPFGWFPLATFLMFVILCSVSWPSKGQLSYFVSRDTLSMPKGVSIGFDTLLVEEIEESLLETSIEDDATLEELAQEWRAERTLLRENPLNINTLTQEDLESFEILSPLAIRNFFLERHRRGGAFHSLSDLKLINGWDRASIERLLPYLTIVPIESSFREQWYRQKGAGRLLMAWSGVAPREEVAGEVPLGGPRTFRGKLHYGQKNLYSLGVMATSGLFEPLLQKGYPFFDRYSFYASFALPQRYVQRLVVGDYRLSLGEGLVLRQQFMSSLYTHYFSSGISKPLKEALTNDEASSMRGVAVEFGGDRLRSLLFFSSKMRDANYDDKGYYGIILGGRHRTDKEQTGRARLRESSFGGRLSYRESGWRIGFNAVTHSWGDNLLRALPRYTSTTAGEPLGHWSNFSFDFHYQTLSGRIASMGEVAWSANRSWAAVGRWQMKSFEGGRYALVARYLTPHYATLYGRSFTHFAAPGNEWGVMVEGELPRWRNWTSRFLVDYYGSIEPRFRQENLTKGIRLEWSTAYASSTFWSWQALVRYQKEQQRGGDFYGRGGLIWSPSKEDRYILFVRYRNGQAPFAMERSKGWSVGIKADQKVHHRGRYGFLLAWFQTANHEARLWLPIHQLSWEHRPAMFWGKGIYADGYLRLAFGKMTAVEGKLSYTSLQPSEEKGAMLRTGWEGAVAFQLSF